MGFPLLLVLGLLALAAMPHAVPGAVPSPVHLTMGTACKVTGPGTCAFQCRQEAALQAETVGSTGAHYRLTCPDVSWTCDQEFPLYRCGLLGRSGAGGPGRCEAFGPNQLLVCRSGPERG